jgi:hypothetical protein
MQIKKRKPRKEHQPTMCVTVRKCSNGLSGQPARKPLRFSLLPHTYIKPGPSFAPFIKHRTKFKVFVTFSFFPPPHPLQLAKDLQRKINNGVIQDGTFLCRDDCVDGRIGHPECGGHRCTSA